MKIYQTYESAKLRALRALAPLCLTHNQYAPYASARLRTLPIINTRLRALRAFVLSCIVLLQLKGKVSFVCSLQLTIHLFFLLLYHIKLFACFFSFFLFKPLVKKIIYTIILQHHISKLEERGEDLMKTVQLLYNNNSNN